MRIVELVLDEDNEMAGIEAISIVESPAIEADFVALKADEIKLAEVDKEKKILMGALLIPNKPIFRNSDDQDDYYIYFSKDTVEKASQLYLKNGNQNNTTLEHQHSLNGLTLVESWLVVDEKFDKSRKYGMNVPVGSWMGSVKVNNDDVWNDYVKTGKVKGFSIEGYFADKMERPNESIKEDMAKEKEALELLSKIGKIVKGEKVELAESILKQLEYVKGVEIFSKNIDIDIKEIEDNKRSLKVDLEDLMEDMGTMAKGILGAEKAAKLLGIETGSIKNYDKAVAAARVGFAKEKEAKKYL